MGDDEVKLLVCNRTSGGPAAVPSIVKQCSKCGHDVWCSARMQNDPMVRAMEPVCNECTFGQSTIPPDAMDRDDVMVHPIAVAEALDHLFGKDKEDPTH